MRWGTTPPPRGRFRIVTRFLWWPVSVSGSYGTRWMEKARVLEYYGFDGWTVFEFLDDDADIESAKLRFGPDNIPA